MATRAAVAVDEGWCSWGPRVAIARAFGVPLAVAVSPVPTRAQLEAAMLVDDGPWFWWDDAARQDRAAGMELLQARLDLAAETAERVDAAEGFVGSYELERGDPS